MEILAKEHGIEAAELVGSLVMSHFEELRIVKRRQRAFKITGLTWIVERSFAWLGRNRRLSKNYGCKPQSG